MPSKKKKYNARFPAGRIKKIMQTDEEVGKVAQAVPIIISRTLELFVESLLTKAMEITSAKNAKTLSPSHMKQCILSESRFDFLKDLVKSLPDVTSCDSEDSTSHTNTTLAASVVNVAVKSETSSVGGRRQQTREEQLELPTPAVAAPNFYRERSEASVSSSSSAAAAAAEEEELSAQYILPHANCLVDEDYDT